MAEAAQIFAEVGDEFYYPEIVVEVEQGEGGVPIARPRRVIVGDQAWPVISATSKFEKHGVEVTFVVRAKSIRTVDVEPLPPLGFGERFR